MDIQFYNAELKKQKETSQPLAFSDLSSRITEGNGTFLGPQNSNPSPSQIASNLRMSSTVSKDQMRNIRSATKGRQGSSFLQDGFGSYRQSGFGFTDVDEVRKMSGLGDRQSLIK